MKGENKVNPLISANLISRLSFWWLKDLIWYGNRHELTPDDLYKTTPEDQSENLLNKIHKIWDNQLLQIEQNKKPSLWKLGRQIHGGQLLKYATLLLIVAIIQIIYPLLLEETMKYIGWESEDHAFAVLLATAFTTCLISETLLKHYGKYLLTRMGMHLKIAVSQLIFRKILRMPANIAQAKSFANLLSNDVNNIELICSCFHNLAIIPFQTIIMTFMMVHSAQIVPALIGVSLMVLQTVPLQYFVYKVTLKLRAKQTAKTDTRIFLISEVINGIRAIKMYVWEAYFENLLSEARRREIDEHLRISYVHGLFTSISNCNSRVTLLFIIIVCSFRDQTLKTSQIVPIMKILWTLKANASMAFGTVRYLVDAGVSIKRIESFLFGEEVGENVQTCINMNNRASTGDTDGVEEVIRISKVTASWTSNLEDKALDNIDIKINRNALCAVTGPVGSGKSSLIKLILGELPPTGGQVCVNGKIAYVDQHPWLFSGSVRDNILFGEKFDKEKYEKVVEACALSEDFRQLPYEDKTLVGESGSMLSGGQRARVNLARAVYRDSDIYLLDDPLSALDVRVSKQIFKNCICELLKNKTRVLVTSNTHLLAEANWVIVLNDGGLEYQGPHIKSEMPSLDFPDDDKSIDRKDSVENNVMPLSNGTTSKPNDKNEPKETSELLVQGNVTNKVLIEYIKAGRSYISVYLWVFGTVVSVVAASGFDYWIVVRSQDYDTNDTNTTHSDLSKIVDKVESTKFISVAGGLVVVFLVTATLRSFVFNWFTLIASKNIHGKMISCLMRAPMRYFEVNSSGRILNRFAEDTGNVDVLVPKFFYEQTQNVFNILTFVLPIVVVDWRYLFLIALLAYAISKVYNFCVPTLRCVKRLERTGKSPVISAASSCYAGRLTIRSYCAEEIVIKEYTSHQDNHTAAYFLSMSLSEGFGLWIDLLINAVFIVVIYFSVLLKNRMGSAGSVGLSLGQILNTIDPLTYLVKQTIELVLSLVTLERMIQFTKMEQEEDVSDTTVTKPPILWPSKGKLEFQHVYLRYSDVLEPALKDIDLVIEPGAKIGIVGRTGAGKSSLISVLFRFTNIDGSLIIDDIDTKSINISHLRSKISIIPQTSTLFNTSLRKNLDPFGTIDDATLWSALNDVEMKSNFDSLEYEIEKDGGNISFGQRQLLCLARVIVKRNKILVLDEATSNLDPDTETIIQKVIRSKFQDCTVITIAHKLSSIMDSDKVIVMDNGQVVEFDPPHLLLQKNGGYFSGMVNQASNDVIQELKSIAEKAYTKG